MADPRPAGAASADVLRVVRRHVRVRFGLKLEPFAERALLIAAAAFPRGPWPDAVARLSLDDLYLGTACAAGEESAWRELAARHAGFMGDFARRWLPQARARELADQVLADLWQRGKIARFEGRSSLRTWLGALVAHAAANEVKARRLAESLEGAGLEARDRSDGGAGGEAVEIEARSAATLSSLVAFALAGMADEDRLLLLLYYEQGMTLDQISRLRGSSKSALSRRLEAVRRSLREKIEEEARRLGASADDLRSGVDLGRLSLDLGSLLSGPSDREGRALELSKLSRGAP